MRLKDSQLVKNLLQGQLPEVKTDNQVKLDTGSVLLIGGVLVAVVITIALAVILVKRS
jgi:hypothetical protein